MLFSASCILLSWLSCPAQTPAIDHWRDHLPYHQAIDILSGLKTFKIPDIRQISRGGDIIVLDKDKYEVKDTYIIGK
jgi:hypothetical protein